MFHTVGSAMISNIEHIKFYIKWSLWKMGFIDAKKSGFSRL